MDEWDELRAQRDELERQLLELERAVEARQQGGMAAPALADRMVGLLARLGQVNAKLSELRGPAASTYPSSASATRPT